MYHDLEHSLADPSWIPIENVNAIIIGANEPTDSSINHLLNKLRIGGGLISKTKWVVRVLMRRLGSQMMNAIILSGSLFLATNLGVCVCGGDGGVRSFLL